MNITIDERLEINSIQILEMDLCYLRLKNEMNYPWFLLIPKIPDVTELFQLSSSDQNLLIKEISQVSKLIKTVTKSDKINIATLGNQVRQLHIHVVGRNEHDSLWPHAIWQAAYVPSPYGNEFTVYAEQWREHAKILKNPGSLVL